MLDNADSYLSHAISTCDCTPFRGATVVCCSGFRDRGFQVRNPIPSKNRRVIGCGACQISRGQMPSRWCVAAVWRGGCRIRCRPRYLTTVQNYEVRPKIVLVLLQIEV
ncbi:hypothetical protein AVEN_9112-1 [Araneus ventricosus]|uniref:Uncharacterized protein n=1 Tax=Araneus ventricosus TaxID=182803 RepID=A0A4Y2P8N6_ARAVE|nr:hypothetical protein AVEN_9112-1 [Araneus ventricosus]